MPILELAIIVVSRGQTLYSCRAFIACSISARTKRVWNSLQGLLVQTLPKCQYAQRVTSCTSGCCELFQTLFARALILQAINALREYRVWPRETTIIELRIICGIIGVPFLNIVKRQWILNRKSVQ